MTELYGMQSSLSFNKLRTVSLSMLARTNLISKLSQTGLRKMHIQSIPMWKGRSCSIRELIKTYNVQAQAITMVAMIDAMHPDTD